MTENNDLDLTLLREAQVNKTGLHLSAGMVNLLCEFIDGVLQPLMDRENARASGVVTIVGLGGEGISEKVDLAGLVELVHTQNPTRIETPEPLIFKRKLKGFWEAQGRGPRGEVWSYSVYKDYRDGLSSWAVSAELSTVQEGFSSKKKAIMKATKHFEKRYAKAAR